MEVTNSSRDGKLSHQAKASGIADEFRLNAIVAPYLSRSIWFLGVVVGRTGNPGLTAASGMGLGMGNRVGDHTASEGNGTLRHFIMK